MRPCHARTSFETLCADPLRESSPPLEHAVYVGDAIWDVRAAARLDLPFVAVASAEKASRLREAGATVFVDDFRDPERVLEALRQASPPRSSFIDVFIQNEAGSNIKNIHDERTLELQNQVRVSRPYPFSYGFVPNTTAADGYNLDCFDLTKKKLSSGKIVRCEIVGLMEQIEDGKEDHNVLAVPMGEKLPEGAKHEETLNQFAGHVFDHIEGKRIRTGRFLSPGDAARWVAFHWDC